MNLLNMLTSEDETQDPENVKIKRISEDLVHVVSNRIQTNFKGCDMVFTLFITALNSYRSDHCLRPFPPNYIRDNVKDIPTLRSLCENIPPLNEFLAQPFDYSDEVLSLFSWLFIEKCFPSLKLLPLNSNVLPNNIPYCYKPQYVFEVHYHPKVDEVFKSRKGDKDLIIAYHGSHIDNFYSILKVGLQQHFSLEKETLFGKGIYLSSECSVSGFYSPFGLTWKNSSLGTKNSIIAVCEIINDIEKVKCKDSENRNRSMNENSTGEIPEKYFVVTDSDMVRLKYLLVYRKNDSSTVKSFFRQNLLWVILGLYFLMLIFIGCNDNPLRKYAKFFIDM